MVGTFLPGGKNWYLCIFSLELKTTKLLLMSRVIPARPLAVYSVVETFRVVPLDEEMDPNGSVMTC